MSTVEKKGLSSPGESVSLNEVKTVDARKRVTLSAESGMSGSTVVEAVALSTPEANTQLSGGGVTTAVKTPCFISYVDSVNNSPASSTGESSSSQQGDSPLTVPVTINGGNTPSSAASEKNFRNVATPATAKKVKKVRAKGVTLFDETMATDLDRDYSLLKAFTGSSNTSSSSNWKTSFIFGCFAISLFAAAFFVNQFTAVATHKVPVMKVHDTKTLREQFHATAQSKAKASKLLFEKTKKTIGDHGAFKLAISVARHLKEALKAGISMERSELLFILSEM